VLGFSLDFWDYATFVAIFVLVAAAVAAFVFLAGLPGRIAIARGHPEAEAVKIMGWAGFLAAVPWIQAFIWAFKPTDVVDIRRFPAEERRAEEADLARLSGTPTQTKAPTTGRSQQGQQERRPGKDDRT
jgi:Protein of unknown function (DUF3302)